MFTLEQIQKRMAEIGTELKLEDADLDSLEKELDDLNERSKVIIEKAEQRKSLINKVTELKGVSVIEKNETEERDKMNVNLGADSKEYRNAFFKNMLGQKMTEAEERAFLHTTSNSEAVVPVETQNKIYSDMEEAHPILKDVNVLRTGAAISITKHTEIVKGDAKIVGEGEANQDEQNEFVRVSLAGKDFSKHVDFSYNLGKMAIPAFEQYLVKEISDRIGAAMAKDIVEQIRRDVAERNSFEAHTPGKLNMADILKGFGRLKGTGQVNVYANNYTIYEGIASMEDGEGRLAFIPNPAEDISGRLLGKGLKEEDALEDGEILILDPNQFTYNIVTDILIEQDRDIKRHVNTIAGYASAEGALVKDKAAALISIGETP